MYGKSNILIDQDLLDRIIEIKQNELNGDSYDEYKRDLIEDIKLTRLSKMVESLDEEEMTVLVLIALQKYPKLVYTILLEEYLLNKERKKDKNERREII